MITIYIYSNGQGNTFMLTQNNPAIVQKLLDK